jgi:hypothetical protein
MSAGIRRALTSLDLRFVSISAVTHAPSSVVGVWITRIAIGRQCDPSHQNPVSDLTTIFLEVSEPGGQIRMRGVEKSGGFRRLNGQLGGYSTFTIAGGCHVPSPTGRIEGRVSFGQ